MGGSWGRGLDVAYLLWDGGGVRRGADVGVWGDRWDLGVGLESLSQGR